MGVAGEKGAESVVRCVGGRCLGKRSSGVGRDMAALGDFGGKTMRRERSFPGRLAKISLGCGCLDGALTPFSRTFFSHRGDLPRFGFVVVLSRA